MLAIMKRFLHLLGFLMLCAGSCAAEPGTCAGSTSLDEFRLFVEPPKGNPPIPVAKINALRTGGKLKYVPIEIDPDVKAKAMISLILAPVPGKEPAEPALLEARPAAKPAEWSLPFDVSIVGVVFGPQGLDAKKIHTLLDKKHQLITQLADYAEQSSNVGALVETLDAWERSPSNQRSLDAVLNGFSSRYGVALPKLNAESRPDEQAMTLLHAVLPSLSSYDPLTAAPPVMMQQSAGLAATMSTLFLGSPVTLAAGGTALFQNLRTLMFPDTEFRSALAQYKKDDQMSLCAKPQTAKSHARTAYLWALRLPASGPPVLNLPPDVRLPLGWKSSVKFTLKDASQHRLLSRVRGWQLVSQDGKEVRPVSLTAAGAAPEVLEMDLSQATIPPGDYRLAGQWDWSTFTVGGTLQLRTIGSMDAARISPASEDMLVEGAGKVRVELTGGDFEFVEKLQLGRADSPENPVAVLPFTRQIEKAGGGNIGLSANLDSAIFPSGAYFLRITQINGKTHDLPLTIHPPNPRITNLPLRANLAEQRQVVILRGSGLERIEKISGRGMAWQLSPMKPAAPSDPEEREAVLTLDDSVHKGERLELCLNIRGLHRPMSFPEAIEVVGPRPQISSVERSIPPDVSVELGKDEIPAGFPVSFALSTRNLASLPVLKLDCDSGGDGRPVLTLKPGEARESAKLDVAGEGVLFLSLDPGKLGPTGCNLTALVESAPVGSSTPVVLGRIVQLPQIEKFELTDERLENSSYVGILTGKNLHSIEKAGWDSQHGYPVLGIPSPVIGQPEKQILRVSLPWPSPAPRAPIFVWLRGESAGRATRARY